MLVLLLSLAACSSLAAAAPSVPQFGPHSLFDAAPPGAVAQYRRLHRAQPETQLNLRLALHQPHFEELTTYLQQSSDPDHPFYGQHLTQEQVRHFSRPAPEAQVVSDWLSAHGVDVQPAHPSLDEFLSFSLDVAQAEALFDTTFHVYESQHPSVEQQQQRVIRTEQLHLPELLHQHVEVIQPTTFFGRMQPLETTVHVVKSFDDWNHNDQVFTNTRVKPHKGQSLKVSASDTDTHSDRVAQECNATAVLPDCLRALYSFPDQDAFNLTEGAAAPGFGVAGYLGQYANHADLQDFLDMWVPDQVNKTDFDVELVGDGAVNSQNLSEAGYEANLDVQWAATLAFPLQPTFYSTNGTGHWIEDVNLPTNNNEPYDVLLSHLLSQEAVPGVLSTSYGEDEQSVPRGFAHKICKMYAALAARGMTAVHSSGDGGITGGHMDGTCQLNDGTNGTAFLPTFPSSCPWVTSVGATQAHASKGFEQEVVAPYSSGGFSSYFEQPHWQKSAVASYLSHSNASSAYGQYFNRHGRAYPDVSAYGTYYGVFWQGHKVRMLGTSASAPTFAAVVALMNLKRSQMGKSTLGFMNQVLYKKLHTAFTDVTSGTNPGCELVGCQVEGCVIELEDGKNGTAPGFEAVEGWDVASGWGTPNVAKLLRMTAELP